MDQRLAGGKDAGAELVDGTVRRPSRAWTRTVHDLLTHLERRDFAGAPRPGGFDEQGREVLTYLPGETVGTMTPCPAWTHSDEALVDVGRWVRDYHAAVAEYVPPPTTPCGAKDKAGNPGLSSVTAILRPTTRCGPRTDS